MKICNFCLKKDKGFTLVELLVTVILVAVLASYSVYYYNNTVDEGRLNAAKGKLSALGGATARYFIENTSITCGAANSGRVIATAYSGNSCGENDSRILDVFACGYGEPSLAYESNFDIFFGCPSRESCGNYDEYTVYMKPNANADSSVFPNCVYFDRSLDKVVDVRNN